MKYLVSHQGQHIGPFTAAEIASQLRSRELESLDYAFDEQRQDWVLLTEIAEVTMLLKASAKPSHPGQPPVKPVGGAAVGAPAAVAPAPVSAAHAVTEWFVLKGETKFGPFPYDEMIGLLQQKIVYPFDFCWHVGMDKWARVADVAQFSPAAVRDLHARQSDVFIPRQFARAAYSAGVLLHDQQRVWRAEARELSRGGLGLRSVALTLTPGQHIHVHCAATETLPAFNALCEVVAKTYVADGSPVEYGLRFLELSPDARASINAKVA